LPRNVSGFVAAHYLHKLPAVVTLSLVMFVLGKPKGMVLYALPPRQTAIRYGGATWELARLYITDDVPNNAETWLISKSVKHIKVNYPAVDFLVSYADPSAGHVGTIYRAANWKADGMTDDERKSPRSDYYDAKTGKKYGRLGHVPEGVAIEKRPRISKYRYVLPLNRRAK